MKNPIAGLDVSRRRMLASLAAVGATAGVATFAGVPHAASTSSPPDTEPTADPSGVLPSGDNGSGGAPSAPLLERGKRRRFTSPNVFVTGEIPVLTTSGDLVDKAGAAIGSFDSAGVGGELVIQSLTFTDGTLYGLGSGPLEETRFAIIGGTDRYGKTTGSYLARQYPLAAGGDGTAEFLFDQTDGLE
jgi:hypothetical protein